MKDVVEKVVCYVVQQDHLLVFTHLDVPLEVTGVQVPAGTIKANESPAEAAIRELCEETGMAGMIARDLGTAEYDLRPARGQIAVRHFFALDVAPADLTARWDAGEPDPEGGGAPHRWTCWWMPIRDAHVLAAGLGARIGRLFDPESDPGSESDPKVGTA